MKYRSISDRHNLPPTDTPSVPTDAKRTSCLIDAAELEALFDATPDMVFFVKDSAARYLYANITMMQRLGVGSRSELVGKRVDEVYPRGLGAAYVRQDADVLNGAIIHDFLELHLYPNQAPGWCLTSKRPLREDGRIRGLVGISRDIGRPDVRDPHYEKLRLALTYLNEHIAENVCMANLAARVGFSLSKLERSFRKVFRLTPQQLLTRLRMQIAMHQLLGDWSIAQIGQYCGFSDQGAFARQFKRIVGVSPSEYRRRRNDEAAERIGADLQVPGIKFDLGRDIARLFGPTDNSRRRSSTAPAKKR